MKNNLLHYTAVRNSLNIVRGCLQMTRAKLNEQERAHLETAVAELTRAELLVREYLEVSVQDVDPYEWVDLVTVVTNVENLLSAYAIVKRVKFVLHLGDDLFLQGNRPRLEQFFLYLLEHALHTAPSGGCLTIQAQNSGWGILLQVQGFGGNTESNEEKQLETLPEELHLLAVALGGHLQFDGTTAMLGLPLD
ncbi:HAMP domain-containing histidine kinase [Tumebacillus sp. ITR2]|uniref:HAMP domain-containing histidine kinase n=1 Tax=Tumebacillus amylolyticus TaxID=2801339 RepID=A0ABS1JG75_9BACL|nr:HAMP domain-containing histidine kinase [Tumebacillus amylolyticus]MBL0389279.1 HAMP domain-containing histidine kinase [Tumebacillus amylolyticus]